MDARCKACSNAVQGNISLYASPIQYIRVGLRGHGNAGHRGDKGFSRPNLCERAVRAARLNEIDWAPREQRGLILFRFRLK